MSQTKEGSLKTSALKAGLSLEEYVLKINNGLKRCTRCHEWREISNFGNDVSRHDGKDATCFVCRRVKERKSTKGRISTFKGKKHSEEAKKAISIAHKGKPSPFKGLPRSAELIKKLKISARMSDKLKRGVDHHFYKHGNCQRNLNQRRSVEYEDWRMAVFTRDKFTCQHCGDNKGGNLQAHHIKGFADHEESRFDLDNGITLCQNCHEKVHLKPIQMLKGKCRRKKHASS